MNIVVYCLTVILLPLWRLPTWFSFILYTNVNFFLCSEQIEMSKNKLWKISNHFIRIIKWGRCWGVFGFYLLKYMKIYVGWQLLSHAHMTATFLNVYGPFLVSFIVEFIKLKSEIDFFYIILQYSKIDSTIIFYDNIKKSCTRKRLFCMFETFFTSYNI